MHRIIQDIYLNVIELEIHGRVSHTIITYLSSHWLVKSVCRQIGAVLSMKEEHAIYLFYLNHVPISFFHKLVGLKLNLKTCLSQKSQERYSFSFQFSCTVCSTSSWERFN